ncbi:MAG TPA: stage V sporulation protein AE [Thermoclostridium caenicola]|uniref:Stage V sporulation protein AE n=1 Tax=Thermoclostridium caenicola TaxID=659425 RepID=A0A1M6BTA6_9FIRM|nr:stage V sporulation protein AE [Thermoclostridium caenicola]SHI51813.1 stage V sporulation protein AE [Thermoclostridium caenicola]HOK43207.1 stage V sporulation protein AE [Thermoclostridium caenicola]HOL84222.1 stage V sporulation protein AE [Thermoclostridium caenicola]HOP71798.1 stage V sporulation protein AE [Thermoclostridium caenicola]HPO75781.1 stage V sporulation protein AE [Thermoclostridium caenicola]
MTDIIKAFVTGGIICVIAQLLIDYTKITPARIMVIFVVSGVILGVLGIYPAIVEFGGAGATIPLTGFGNTLAKGVMKAVNETGLVGVLTGGVKAAAAGISSAITFGYIMAIVSKPKLK